MKRLAPALALAALLLPQTAAAQAESAFKDQIMGHFDASTRKVAMLAEAMPERHYGWSPEEGVMPVVQVYMHITRYNFMYLEDNLGVPAPADIDVANLETITDKATTLELLDRSISHVKEAVGGMTGADLAKPTRLYGQQVAGWAVLLQLVAHMNEHLGQSIAYARSNGVVPPWSS